MDMKNMKERKVLEQEWRKGPWAPEEDKLLNEYVSLHGEGRWTSAAKFSGLKRCGKSCRLRWVNYLRPGLKRGHITPQEEGIIIELHALWGNKWSTIARYLHGRTDNEIKNYWRTHFKNKDKASAHKQLKQRAPLGLPENLQTPKRRHHHHYENDMKSSSPPEAQDQAAPSQDQQVHELASLMDLDDQCLTPTKIYWDAALWNNNCSLMGSDQECGLWGGLWNLDDDGPYNKKTMMNLNDQDHGYADQQNVSYPTSTDNGNEG